MCFVILVSDLQFESYVNDDAAFQNPFSTFLVHVLVLCYNFRQYARCVDIYMHAMSTLISKSTKKIPYFED